MLAKNETKMLRNDTRRKSISNRASSRSRENGVRRRAGEKRDLGVQGSQFPEIVRQKPLLFAVRGVRKDSKMGCKANERRWL